MDIDTFLANQIASFAYAGFVFSIGGVMLYMLRSFFQYKTARRLKHEHPWFAYIPVFSWLQMLQMGGHKIRWVLLIFVPAILETVIPTSIALGLLILVFIGLGIKTLLAAINILKQTSSHGWYGLLLLLPIVNIAVLWDCSRKSQALKKYPTHWVRVIGILLLGSVLSTLSLCILFILFGWIGFGNDFWSLLDLLSDPNTSPSTLLGSLLDSHN